MVNYEVEIRGAFAEAWDRLSGAANISDRKPPSLAFSMGEAKELIIPKMSEVAKKYSTTLGQETEGRELALGDAENGVTYCQVLRPPEGRKFPVQLILGPVYLGNFNNPGHIRPYANHEMTHVVRCLVQPEVAVYSDIFSERTHGVLRTLRDVLDFSVEESIAWVVSFLETKDANFIIRHLRRLRANGSFTAEDITAFVRQINAAMPTARELLVSNGFMSRLGESMKASSDQRTREMGDAYLGRMQDLKKTREWMDGVGTELYVL
ncbi:MAG: hypothetical protein HYS53_02855 [Candidatus Aenigmarchaeota archaeon]|nr:hypothetical protein [Candidatus Aenigmarchaeota archaeon]